VIFSTYWWDKAQHELKEGVIHDAVVRIQLFSSQPTEAIIQQVYAMSDYDYSNFVYLSKLASGRWRCEGIKAVVEDEHVEVFKRSSTVEDFKKRISGQANIESSTIENADLCAEKVTC